MRRLAFFVAAATAGFSALLGCLGEDISSVPETSTGDSATDAAPSGPDAAVDDGSVDGDSGRGPDADAADGAEPSCWKAPFEEFRALDTGGWQQAVYGPRLRGAEAIFAAMPSTDAQRLYRAPWTNAADGGLFSLALGTSTVVPLGTDTTSWHWSPTPLPDGSLVLATSPSAAAARVLARAPSTGAGFGTPSAIFPASGQDEADPWFVGPTNGGALYFSRGPTNGVGAMIWRSAVSAGPTFATPQVVTVDCPRDSCGTPVVAPDQGHLLFSAFQSRSSFQPIVLQARLANVAGAWVTSEVVALSEFGTAYPTWVSADGCTALAARRSGTVAPYIDTVEIARRTPR